MHKRLLVIVIGIAFVCRSDQRPGRSENSPALASSGRKHHRFGGTFVLSTGEKYSENGTELNAGAFALMPQRTWHHGHFKGDTVLQAHGMGPFIINFGPLEPSSGSGK